MRCSHFNEVKGKKCNVHAVAGKAFCGVHNPSADSVPCPANPAHSVLATRLEAHMKVCPDAARDSRHLPCYRSGCNVGEPFQNDIDVPVDDDALFAKVRSLAAEMAARWGEVEIVPLTSDNIIPLMAGGKHTAQHVALAALIAPLLPKATTVVEMCAGRACFAAHLRETLYPDRAATRIIALDRSNFRDKKDVKSGLERVTIDVADLHWATLIQGEEGASVGVCAKHACGVATDLILRCITSSSPPVGCVAIALCCHHACGYARYMRECLPPSLTPSEFRRICQVSCWAVDGTSDASIGRDCKAVLNYGRVAFMEAMGYRARLVFYTSLGVTKENVALVCVPK